MASGSNKFGKMVKGGSGTTAKSAPLFPPKKGNAKKMSLSKVKGCSEK